jgi:glycosyltransferase involved in cell wall biosynthesis
VRVVRIITRLNIGGPSIQAMALTDRLTACGYETTLVHGRLGAGEGDMSDLAAPAADLRRLRALRREVAPLHDAVALVQLVDLMRDLRPAIVHTHMAKAGTLGRLAAAIYNRTAGRRARARVVHTYHGHVLEGYFSPAKTRLFTAIERRLAAITDRIIAISPRIERELVDEHAIGHRDQYRVVPLGFDLDRFAAIDEAARRAARAALGVGPEAHVVATVGRLTAIKQHALFLETARRVADADRSAIFLVAGDGELRTALEEAARTAGIADRIRFLGWRRDLETIYGGCDVFLLTSRNEGTPVALIEALAAGVPGVSTDVGGVADVLDGERAGRLAPFGDADTLAAHVVTLLGDPGLRRRLGETGRRSVLARYAIDRLVRDVDAVYREVLH